MVSTRNVGDRVKIFGLFSLSFGSVRSTRKREIIIVDSKKTKL